ncbi:MAG: nucleotide kinase domain-containing protein [Thermoguttaceae bacterium]
MRLATDVFDTYWRFAAERQNVFFARAGQQPEPWSDDVILNLHRFTNAYRAADRVSQYLIRDVVHGGDNAPEEVFFRTLVFKTFNRIETWEILLDKMGDVRWDDYSFPRYSAVLTAAMQRGTRIYSPAYMMPPGGKDFGYNEKHKNHLKLIERMMREDVPARIADAQSMEEAYQILLRYPTIGPFLAYQYVTDINYSELTDFSEMQFVVPGPGARDGIHKCFSDLGNYSESDIIRYVADHQEEEFEKRGLKFHTLWGRRLQLIDCQNLFCEVDKYARVAHPEITGKSKRTRIKRRFKPNPTPIEYWFPPKWGINEKIPKGLGHDQNV